MNSRGKVARRVALGPAKRKEGFSLALPELGNDMSICLSGLLGSRLK